MRPRAPGTPQGHLEIARPPSLVSPNNLVDPPKIGGSLVKHIPVYWQTCVYAVLIAAFFVPVATATTIVMPTDGQLIVKSPVIVEGTVVSSVPVQIGTRIWTETQVNV